MENRGKPWAPSPPVHSGVVTPTRRDHIGRRHPQEVDEQVDDASAYPPRVQVVLPNRVTAVEGGVDGLQKPHRLTPLALARPD